MCTSWQGVIAQLTCANVDEEPAKLRDAPVDFDDVTELRVAELGRLLVDVGAGELGDDALPARAHDA